MIELWSDEVEQRVRAEAHSLDEQTTPTEVVFCKRCVLSNQRPRIVFDDEGVCSACRYAETKTDGTIDWLARAVELGHLTAKHRLGGEDLFLQQHGSARGYDVVVPCSGGKDASMIAHRLKHEHGMNPLCVTWAPFKHTDIGWKNMQSFIHSGFDVQMGFPGGIIHRKLARLSMEFIGDPFLPFVWGQLYYPLHIAKHHGINLIFGGENQEAEYGGDPSANNKPGWDFDDWERVYLKGGGARKLLDLGYELGCFSLSELVEATCFYSQPIVETLPEYHWFGYYRKWHPQENYYYASEHTGFEGNPAGRSTGTYSKYASLDDALDDPHYFFSFLKFGMGRCTSDAAHEIRDGEITREEAVALVRKYDGEYPINCLEEFLPYVGCDEFHFETVCNRFRPSHLWDYNQKTGAWELKHKVENVKEETNCTARYKSTQPSQDGSIGGTEETGGSV